MFKNAILLSTVAVLSMPAYAMENNIPQTEIPTASKAGMTSDAQDSSFLGYAKSCAYTGASYLGSSLGSLVGCTYGPQLGNLAATSLYGFITPAPTGMLSSTVYGVGSYGAAAAGTLLGATYGPAIGAAVGAVVVPAALYYGSKAAYGYFTGA